MINYLKGTVIDSEGEALSVFTNGLGYEVYVSAQHLAETLPGENIELWIYTHVREDQLVLFGFRTKAEKQLFLSLNKVNGIGPKVAIRILGAAPLSLILQMIDAGDVAGLSKLPKVGKKTAETIILELRGKLVQLEAEKQNKAFAARAEIVSALVNLGFKSADVEKAVASMGADTDMQTGVRQGLKLLTADRGI